MLIELRGKKGLVVGIANEHSIAYGCAKAFREGGADLAITYLNEKASKNVIPLAKILAAEIILPFDVQKQDQLKAVIEEIKQKWGKLDFLLHSIAFAPKEDLYGRVTDCSKEGFMVAMDVSCYSLIQMAKMVEPLMTEGGSILTVSYLGGDKVVRNYNVMGVVKAALESTTRYLAYDLGKSNIRVNAISPGPILTRAASGISDFNEILDSALKRSPLGRLVSIDSVGNLAAFLMSDAARDITGHLHYVDAGSSIVD